MLSIRYVRNIVFAHTEKFYSPTGLKLFRRKFLKKCFWSSCGKFDFGLGNVLVDHFRQMNKFGEVLFQHCLVVTAVNQTNLKILLVDTFLIWCTCIV